MIDRCCNKCGCWGAEAVHSAPVIDCGCTRCMKVRVENLQEALLEIHTHIFADLPAIRAPLGNRLQRIAALCTLAVPELLNPAPKK